MPFTGVIADILDRRKVMLTSDVLRMFTALCFLFVLIDPTRLYWILYIILVIMWSFNSFFDPCREGLIPLVVPKEELVTANVLESLTWMCCSFFGSFLGGLVTSTAGVGANFILDAFTFLLSSICIAQLFRFRTLDPAEIKKSLKKISDAELEQHITNNTESIYPNEAETVTKQDIIEDEHAIIEEIPDTLNDKHIKSSNFLNKVYEQMREFMVGIRFIFKNPYILSLVFIKACCAINYSPRDFVTMKMFFEVFQPAGDIQDAAWTYGMYRAIVGLSSGLFPVIVERILPKNYSAKTMRLVLLCCLCLVVPAYVIILVWSKNIYGTIMIRFQLILTCFKHTLWQQLSLEHVMERHGLFQYRLSKLYVRITL